MVAILCYFPKHEVCQLHEDFTHCSFILHYFKLLFYPLWDAWPHTTASEKISWSYSLPNLNYAYLSYFTIKMVLFLILL